MPGTSTKLIQAKVTPEEESTYRALADTLGVKLSELMRSLLAERLAKFRKTGGRLKRR
jgi:hypothetical protein